MRTPLFRAAAAGALAALCLGPAQAANVTLTGWAYGSGNTVSTSLYSGQAGGFVGSLNGAGAFNASPFITYCVELSESFSFGTKPMTGYAIASGDSYFGSAKAEQLGRLMTWVAAHPQAVDTAPESTALQLAIWNIVYDGDWNVGSQGQFRDSSAFAPAADSLLAQARAMSGSSLRVFALTKSGSQDFLLLQTVPEPASLALVAGALGAAAWAARRRAVRPGA